MGEVTNENTYTVVLHTSSILVRWSLHDESVQSVKLDFRKPFVVYVPSERLDKKRWILLRYFIEYSFHKRGMVLLL